MARQDPTEYGGGERGLDRLPDGTPRKLSVGERARILRQMGAEPNVPEASVVPNDGEPAARTAARKRLNEETNGYWNDPQVNS